MTIYHRIPPNLKGEYLLPLNKMKDIDEGLYNECSKKYQGREELMNVVIPKLDCKWNDVIFFSPVYPLEIKKAYESIVGRKWSSNDWFEISIDELEDFEAKTVIYQSKMKRNKDFSINPEEVTSLNNTNLSGLKEMPQRTLDYYQKNKDKIIFLFHGIPHVLYKGAIKIDKFRKLDITIL